MTTVCENLYKILILLQQDQTIKKWRQCVRIYTKCWYCCNRAVQPKRQKFYADPGGGLDTQWRSYGFWNWPWPAAGLVWRGGGRGGEEGSPATAGGHCWPAGGTTSRQVINYHLRWKSQWIKIHRLVYKFLNPYPIGYGFLSRSPSFLFGNHKHLTIVFRILVWFG